MNGFEIGMILLAMALGCLWLSTPGDEARGIMSQQDKDALAFKKALQQKYLAQQKEHGRRVEARSKYNG